jgi:hypothetical protein
LIQADQASLTGRGNLSCVIPALKRRAIVSDASGIVAALVPKSVSEYLAKLVWCALIPSTHSSAW